MKRVLISPERVAVSRPGRDVLTAAINSDNLAFDSSFNIVRPVLVGKLFGYRVIDAPSVYYPQRYASRPAVYCYPFQGTSVRNEPMLYSRVQQANGQFIDAYLTSFAIDHYNDHFQIVPADAWNNIAWRTTAYDWLYVVWPTS